MGTKTPFITTSLLSVPRMPSESQVSTISTSLVRSTRPSTWGIPFTIFGASPSITSAVRNSHVESWMLLASGPRPVIR